MKRIIIILISLFLVLGTVPDLRTERSEVVESPTTDSGQAGLSLTSFAFCTVVFASEKTASSKVRQITGNVTAIDIKTNTVTIKKKNKKVILSVQEKTNIIQCTKKIALTDIKVGGKVTAKYKEADGKNTAKSITIREVSERVD